MNVEEKDSIPWTEPGQVVKCLISGEVFGKDPELNVSLRLRVDDILEKFDGRRVLVASALEVLEGGEDFSDDERVNLLHPTYLIEETIQPNRRDIGWPEEVADLVRSPVSVEKEGSLTRSIFVDNVGLSVGDLVDLVRGELEFEQVRLIFRIVGKLFVELHEAGWIHLGLTPWNVRIFDRGTEDGFPQEFISHSLGSDFAAPDSEPLFDESEASIDFGGGDNPFDAQAKTVTQTEPLIAERSEAREAKEDEDGHQELSEPTGLTGAGLNDSDSVTWSEVIDDEEVVDEKEGIAAIFDGIDRLFPSGKIDDEIAVTPGFSAPELLSGMGSRDGETADIFSLGMFLYFLVAGEVPPASVYTRYAPAIPARNFRPSFPPGLQAVISRAARPRPDDRYASVRSMMDAFENACLIMEQRRAASSEEPPSMRLASETHIGIAKRRRNPTNQDHVFSAASEDSRFSLVVVADGVSTASYGSGDLASAALTEEAAKVWEDVLPAYLMDEKLDDVEIIQTILRRANKRIVNYVNENHSPFRGSPHEVMGSTALVAVIFDGVVTLAALGDSRVYLQRGAGMEQMTIDHNLWTLSILEGVHADSALAMPHGDALARCLGTFVIEDGILNAVDPQPDLFRFRVIDGDTLLLTTDGLVDFAGTNLLVSEDNILSVLLAEPDPALACLEFILLANRGGGGDNIGLTVARFF